MDVTCERCGTEYEFDETLVSDRGTTVKCTNCGHLFKVFRSEQDGSGAKTWSVQTGDGRVRTLRSLKELQRLITDGQLTEHDLISRGGDEWKRLGDIAELATFFAAASAATADTELDRFAGRERKATRPGTGAAPDRTEVEPPSAPPPRSGPAKSTKIGHRAAERATKRPPRPPRRADPGATTPARQPPRPPPRAPAPERPRPPASPPRARPDPTGPHRPDRQPPQPPRAKAPPTQPLAPPRAAEKADPLAPTVSASADAKGRNLYLDDKEPAAPARGRSRSGLWVALIIGLVAVVSVGLLWPQIAPHLGLAPEAEDPTAPHLEAGDRALAADTVEGYEQAIHHYTQALAFDDHSVPVLSRMSRAHAAWAQSLRFDADDLAARAEEDPTLGGRASALRADADRRAQTAHQRAADAVRYGTGDVEAEVALVDGLRLTGDLGLARRRLDRALTLEPEPSAETLRVAALLAAAEQEDDLSAAVDHAELAVAEDPAMIRARLLLARALLANNDVSGARAQIDAVTRRVPTHPGAIALRDAIEEGRPPAPPTVDVPDEEPIEDGEEGEGDAEEPATDEGASTQGPANGARRPRPEGGAPRGRDYAWYIDRGDTLLRSGQHNQAWEMYQAATRVRPAGSEALTGLGYVALEQGNANEAASRFRQAAGQGYADAYIGLGAAYRRLGRNEHALTAYERYLERLPSGPRAAVARRQVEELRAIVGGGSGGSDNGGGSTGGTSPEPGGSTPPNNDGTLPPPRDMEEPPPPDVPAIGSEP